MKLKFNSFQFAFKSPHMMDKSVLVAVREVQNNSIRQGCTVQLN